MFLPKEVKNKVGIHELISYYGFTRYYVIFA